MNPSPPTPHAEHQTPGPPTLAAILTPLGEGGIAIVHILGPAALDLARQLFRPKAGGAPQPDARRLRYGHIVDEGEVVDEVLVRIVPPEPRAGGQPLVEVNCHGGVVAVQRVLDCFVRRGAQAVEPDALVRLRARSAIEAEAIRALVEAPTRLGAEILLDQLGGALERALCRLAWEPPGEAAAAIRRLLATEGLGRALWRPLRVALVGPANAGKSTLFNALAREDRMIVSPTAGTTRDAVSAVVALGGLPILLTDTAGQRAPPSAIEREATGRARAAAAEADLVLRVLDGSAERPPEQHRCPPPTLTVVTKADLPLAPWAEAHAEAGGITVSGVTGHGLDTLCDHIVRLTVGEARREPGAPVVFTERQAALLRRALAALDAGAPADARVLVEETLGSGE